MDTLKFISKEQSRRLREAGFNDPVDFFYPSDLDLAHYPYRSEDYKYRHTSTTSIGLTKDDLPAATVVHAIRWMANRLEVHAFVGRYDVPEIHGYGVKSRYLHVKIEDVDFDCEEDADSALLDECLKIFEELRELKLVS